MDHYPPGGQKGRPEDDLRDIDDPFVLDKNSGIYQPKATKEEEEAARSPL